MRGALLGLVTIGVAACESAQVSIDTGPLLDAQQEASPPLDAPHDAAPSIPPGDGGGVADSGPARVRVTGAITTDATWTRDRVYALRGVVEVTNGATLTIEGGTEVRGEPGSALVVQPRGRLVAEGSEAAPVVLTGDFAIGERGSGDWGGLVLLGLASTNADATLPIVPGIPGTYGGSDDAHDCGTLRYLRVQYAGGDVGGENARGSLTLAGCGTATVVDYVHVHESQRQGMQILGGTASVRHVVISSAEEDGLQWGGGWRGSAQFLIVQMPIEARSALDGHNHPERLDAEPRSTPLVSNATLVGARVAAVDAQHALVAGDGSGARIVNSILLGLSGSAIDVQSPQSARLAGAELDVSHSIYFAIGADGTTWFNAGESDDDGGFDEGAFFMHPERMSRFGVDPAVVDAFHPIRPDFGVDAASPAAMGAAPTAAPLSPAPWIGAIEPGGQDWTAGWTCYELD